MATLNCTAEGKERTTANPPIVPDELGTTFGWSDILPMFNGELKPDRKPRDVAGGTSGTEGDRGALLTAIGEAFSVDLSHDAEVKRADLLALRKEAETFLPEPSAEFADLPMSFVDDIIPWRLEAAEKNFLLDFRSLRK